MLDVNLPKVALEKLEGRLSSYREMRLGRMSEGWCVSDDGDDISSRGANGDRRRLCCASMASKRGIVGRPL